MRNALREARRLGLVTVEERRLARFRNDTNVVCIVSREWSAWLRLARSGERATVARLLGGWVQIPEGHEYSCFLLCEFRGLETAEGLPTSSGRRQPIGSVGYPHTQ